MKQRRDAATDADVPQNHQSVSETTAPVNGRRPPTSEKKISANRQNAKNSTGPKSERGKARSRRNAIKHGFFAEQTTFEDLPSFEENPEDFTKLLRRLWEEYDPVGPTEENLVQYIAIQWLRSRRLWLYEEALRESNQHSVALRASDEHYPVHPRVGNELRLLRKAETECASTGDISPETRNEILESLDVRLSWKTAENAADQTLKGQRRKIAIEIAKQRDISVSEAKALLRKDAQSLPEYQTFRTREILRILQEWKFRQWNLNTSIEIQSDYGRALIPDADEIEKIMRYGSWVQRELARAYDSLMLFQRQRKERQLLSTPTDLLLSR